MSAHLPLALALVRWALAPGVDVHIPASAGCPQATQVAASIAEIVGADPPRGSLVVERDGASWRVTVRVTGHDGQSRAREFSNQSCAAAVEGGIAVLAVALADARAPADPLASRPPTAGPPDDLDPVAPIGPRGPLARASIAPAAVANWVIGARVGLGHGPLPRVSATVGLTLAAQWPRVSLGIHADVWTPQRATIDDAAARFMMFSAGPRLCRNLRARRVELPMCGFGSFGFARGVATDPRFTHDPAVSAWAAFGAAVGVRIPVAARVAITLGAESQWSLMRPRLGLPAIGPLCCGTFGLQALAGVELRGAPRTPPGP